MQQTFMSTKLLMTCLLFAVLAVSTACDREDDLSLTGTSWKLYGYVNTANGNIRIQEPGYQQISILFVFPKMEP